jgi:hypothetical protein
MRSGARYGWGVVEDPFEDSVFVSRLQKLMPLLASEQPGEADAARRKLLEHLAAHRLSLTDVASRVGQAAIKPSFVQGAREMGLERQLHVARVSRQETEAELHRAAQRIADLQRNVQEVSHEAARAFASQGRLRLLASSGWIVAGIVGALMMVARLHSQGVAEGQAIVTADQAMMQPAQGVGDDAVLRLSPGEHYGTVLVQDLAIRLSPSEDSTVRAFLNRGMRVVVQQQVRVGLQSWLLIRSVTGSGWVRSSAVL